MSTAERERRSMTVAIEGGVAEVCLTGPGRGNALGPDLWRELPLVFGALDTDPAVRAVVLYGQGKNFTYGLDLMAMMGEMGPHVTGPQMAGQRTRLLRFIERLQASVSAVADCHKPVVCAIHGWCIGGGLDIATACDFRLASADAKISLRETRLAIVADLGSLQRLPAIVGQGHAREMAYTGRDVGSEEALAMGLVNRIYPDREALLEGARAAARAIADNPAVVVQGVKQVLGFSQGKSAAEGLAYVAAWNSAFLQSADLAEAFQAFMERRPARFNES